MKEWWEKLAPREQKIMIAGGSFLILFLLYSLLWSPFTNKVQSLHETLDSQQKLVVWMQSAHKTIKQSQGSVAQREEIGTRSLLNLADKSLKKSSLKSHKADIVQIDNGQIRIQYTSVPFPDLLVWLESFLQQYQAQIMQVNITNLEAAGQVQAEIILKSL